jgi:hypothetical protein
MNTLESPAAMLKRITDRRAFVKGLGLAGLGVAGANMMGCSSSPAMAATSGTDTAQQIFTAALIAEDLATTFYYTGLTTDAIIQDPNLAGAGGSATNVQAGGAVDDVGYIRAALSEEIMHADLLRSLIGGSSAAGDPVQTFFPHWNIYQPGELGGHAGSARKRLHRRIHDGRAGILHDGRQHRAV